MKKKLILCGIMMLLCSVLLCNNGTAAAAKKGKITKVSITKPATETLTIKKGSTYQLKVSVKGTAKNKKLAYKTSNSKVVKVSKTGKLKAVKKGSAKITVSSKFNLKKKDTLTVSVGTKVSKVALDKSTAALKVGEKVTLKATISPAKASNKKVSWKSSDSSVAEVSGGIVTAKKIGSADITATAKDGSGKKAVCKLTVATNAIVATTNLDDVKVTTDQIVRVKLSSAKALKASDFAISTKLYGSNATNVNVNKIYTKDNINYCVYLKSYLSYGYYVAVTIPSLDGVKTKEVQYIEPLKLNDTNIVSGIVGRQIDRSYNVPYELGNITCKVKSGTLPAGINLQNNKLSNDICFTGMATEVANGTAIVITITDEAGRSTDVNVKFYFGDKKTILVPIESSKSLVNEWNCFEVVGGSGYYSIECVSTPSAISFDIDEDDDSIFLLKSNSVGSYDVTVKIVDNYWPAINKTVVIHMEVSEGYTVKGVLINEKGEKLKNEYCWIDDDYVKTDENGAFSIKLLPGNYSISRQYVSYFKSEDFTVGNSDLDLGEVVIPDNSIVRFTYFNPGGISTDNVESYEVINDKSMVGHYIDDVDVFEDGVHYLMFKMFYNNRLYYARKTITMNGDNQNVTVSASDWIVDSDWYKLYK